MTILFRPIVKPLSSLVSNLCLLVVLAAVLASCAGEPESVEISDGPLSEESVGEINWFAGSVDEAFAFAQANDKPIFLYWGAEWCPPCHAIKATVFNRPEFIERSKLFVPVYLDGDHANAQAYGEKFGVLGYPTMVVFDPSGVEVTRIPGGIDIQAYANILDLTLSGVSSASAVVDRVMSGSTITSEDCRLLAYHSWGQDTEILSGFSEVEAFRTMYDACPEDMQVEGSILYFSWLERAIEQAQLETDSVPLTDAERAEARVQFRELLSKPALIKANIFTVLFSGADLIKELTSEGTDERTELVANITRVYNDLAADESVYKRERIYTLAGKIGLERIDDQNTVISEQLQQEIRDLTEWADQTTPSVYERQPIINALANVLQEAEMDELAKSLLLAEVEKSQQPYYYMPDLAAIERRAGNDETAMGWLKRGYDISTGAATRFQWGYYYLTGLLEMQPADAELIERTMLNLLAELQRSNAFHHRPKAQLDRLENRLFEWAEEHQAQPALDSMRASVAALCAQIPEADAGHETCAEFLAAG